jgi:hypothetical protein
MEKFIPTKSILKTHEDLEQLLNEGETFLRRIFSEQNLPEYQWNNILVETNNIIEELISNTEYLELIVDDIQFKRFNTVIEFGFTTIKLPNDTFVEKIRGNEEIGNWIYEDETGKHIYEPDLYIITFKNVIIFNPQLPPYKKQGFNKFSVPNVNFMFISSEVDNKLKRGDRIRFNLNFVFKTRFRKNNEFVNLNYYDKKNIIPPIYKSSNSNCFIVTTTMGDINHPVVVDFRRYRDEVLLYTYFGRVFINIYYRIGPLLSKVIKSNSFLFTISKNIVLKLHKLINSK